MISDSARAGFTQLLTQAIETSFVTSREPHCEVRPLAELPQGNDGEMVVITISSYLFRLVVMIHFSCDDATHEHFGDSNDDRPIDTNKQSLLDAIAERANMCCGVFNRSLGNYFPHLGMSTPNFLSENCIAYLERLQCGHTQHFLVTASAGARFHVSMCVCDFADLDFAAQAQEIELSTGELELF